MPTGKKGYDKKTVFYGPHPCQDCDRMIVMTSRAEGGIRFDVPLGPVYPNSIWNPHHCTATKIKTPRAVVTGSEETKALL